MVIGPVRQKKKLKKCAEQSARSGSSRREKNGQNGNQHPQKRVFSEENHPDRKQQKDSGGQQAPNQVHIHFKQRIIIQRIVFHRARTVFKPFSAERKKLPIPAYPAVLPFYKASVAPWEIIIQMYVGDECCTQERALDQIVAQYAVFAEAPLQKSVEYVRVIHALPRINPLIADVKIKIRCFALIGVIAFVITIYFFKRRCMLPVQAGGRHRRLKQRIAFRNDGFRAYVGNLRTVQRMMHDLCHSDGRIDRDNSVGIYGQYIIDAREPAFYDCAVQLDQRAALPLRAHPCTVSLVIYPFSNHHMKFFGFLPARKAFLQIPHGPPRILYELLVFRPRLAFTLRQIAEDGKIDSRLWVGPGSGFQLFYDFIDTFFGIEQAGDYDHDFAVLRQDSLKIQFRQ